MKMEDLTLYHRGSVKDIYLTPDEGVLAFLFSDRYSVFDWGDMPDHIPGKGKSLGFLAALFFEVLGNPMSWRNWSPPNWIGEIDTLNLLSEFKEKGCPHHYLGQIEGVPESLLVKKVDVPKLEVDAGRYRYSHYKTKPSQCLVPLEVIFRFGLPQGSSLFKRLGNDEYKRCLGLMQEPKVGDTFKRPVIEFSTKLEKTDRYLTYSEAAELSGLSDNEFSRLYSQTSLIALRLKDLFLEVGIELWDGKFEFSFSENTNGRQFMLVDSIGPDELRLMVNGEKLSKEFLRSFYRGSDWLRLVEEMKMFSMTGWKAEVLKKTPNGPKSLSAAYLETATELYQSLAGSIGKIFGKGYSGKFMPLHEVAQQMKRIGKNEDMK